MGMTDWTYLFWFLLGALLFFGAKFTGKGSWNEEYTSLKQTKVLLGIMTLGVALHHLSQKSCAPWHPQQFVVHGLDFFLPLGPLLVGVFLFCSGLGLYKSYRTKPDYLKGFCRRRILPVVIAFYLSEILYTVIRLLMGEKMDFTTVLWYLSGLHMANENAWYVIVIPFFYFAFWAAFRFCKREGTAIFCVFLFTIAYTVLGACIDHQSKWWMRGEWWYNSILLFPLGLLFGKHEEKVTRFVKKGYWFWLVLSFACIFLLNLQSEWLINTRWGYYGEYGDPLKIPHRLLSAGAQWGVCIAFVCFWFLLMMKVKLGNRALAWLGAVSLDFYLMHGIFVELFGYNFLGISWQNFYIVDPGLYAFAALGCSVPAAILFRWIRFRVTGWTQKKDRPEVETPEARIRQRRGMRKSADAPPKYRKFLMPAVLVLFFAGLFVFFNISRGDEHVFEMNRIAFTVPKYYQKTYSDTRNVIYRCTGEDGKKTANLIADAIIPDGNERSQESLESLAACDWLTEQEEYVNPQGIRMIRGFVEVEGHPERRYYIDHGSGLMVIRMMESPEYYSVEDCEEAMRKTVESARRK